MTLKTEITDDIDTFLDTNEFAVSYTYNSNIFKGIFDDAYKGINLATGEIETKDPQIKVKSSNVSGIEHANSLVINSITYYVTGIHPDGTGFTKLMLSKDTPNG